MGYPAASAPEASGAHKPVRWEDGDAAIRVHGLPRQEGARLAIRMCEPIRQEGGEVVIRASRRPRWGGGRGSDG